MNIEYKYWVKFKDNYYCLTLIKNVQVMPPPNRMQMLCELEIQIRIVNNICINNNK